MNDAGGHTASQDVETGEGQVPGLSADIVWRPTGIVTEGEETQIEGNGNSGAPDVQTDRRHLLRDRVLRVLSLKRQAFKEAAAAAMAAQQMGEVSVASQEYSTSLAQPKISDVSSSSIPGGETNVRDVVYGAKNRLSEGSEIENKHCHSPSGRSDGSNDGNPHKHVDIQPGPTSIAETTLPASPCTLKEAAPKLCVAVQGSARTLLMRRTGSGQSMCRASSCFSSSRDVELSQARQLLGFSSTTEHKLPTENFSASPCLAFFMGGSAAASARPKAGFGTTLEYPLKALVDQYTVALGDEDDKEPTSTSVLPTRQSKYDARDNREFFRDSFSHDKPADMAGNTSPRGGTRTYSHDSNGQPGRNTVGSALKFVGSKLAHQLEQHHSSNFVLEKIRQRAASYTYSHAGKKGETRAEDDAGAFQMHMAYVKPVSFVLFAILDLVAALVVQLFWSIDDFACLHSSQGQGHVRKQIMALIAIILIFYAYNIGLALSELDSGGKLYMLRFVRRRLCEDDPADHNRWNPMWYFGLLFCIVRGLVRHLWDITILSCSVAVLLAHSSVCDSFEDAKEAQANWPYVFVRRLHIVVHFVRAFGGLWSCMGLQQELQTRLQAAVSLNKRRFVCKHTRFDLDLTYICDRVIAMAMPCVDGATMYRNNIREVARFFASRHYSNFLVFNLCEAHEEGGNGNYDIELLYGQVQKLPMRDHNVPALHCIVQYCEQASAWLNLNMHNVIAVHCQGGKGRTGTFCAALMMWTRFKRDAKDALDSFATRRTDIRKGKRHVQGVAAPCQIRYVHYLDALLEASIDYRSPRTFLLDKITIRTMPLHTKEHINVSFVIEVNGRLEYDHLKAKGLAKLHRQDPSKDEWDFDVGYVSLCGDVSIRFYYFEEDNYLSRGAARGNHQPTHSTMEDTNQNICQSRLGPGARSIKFGSHTGKQLFFVTFHTSFHEGDIMEFGKREVDGAYNHRGFLESFGMSLSFVPQSKLLVAHTIPVANSPAPFELVRRELGLIKQAPPRLSTTKSGSCSRIGMMLGSKTSVRYMAQNQRVRDVMIRLCTTPETFKKGQIVFNTLDTSMDLLFIEKGSCTLHIPGFNTWEVNNDTSINGLPIGSNSFLGVHQFLLGTLGDVMDGAVIRAWTEEVVVRRIHIQKTKAGHVPIKIGGMSESEVLDFFEFIARCLCEESAMMKMRLERLIVMAKSKHDTNVHISKAARAKQTRQIMDKFRIPVTEQMIERVIASLIHDDERTVHQGQVFLFSNWLIFSGPTQSDSNLLMPIRNVIDVTVDGHVLSVTLNSDAEDESNQMPPALCARAKQRPSVADLRINVQTPPMLRPSPSLFRSISNFFMRCMDSFKGKRRFDMSFTSRNSSGDRLQQRDEKGVGSSRRGSQSNLMGLANGQTMGTQHGSGLIHLVKNQGIVTFFFKLRNVNGGLQMLNAVHKRIAEVSKEMSVEGLLKTANKSNTEDQADDGFGYVFHDDTVDENDDSGVLDYLFQTAQVISFHQGQVIVNSGDCEKRLWHVIRGKVYMLDSAGMVVSELGQGELFGITCFLDSGNRGQELRVVAGDQVDLLVLSSTNIELISSVKPLIGARIFRNLAITSALRARQDLRALQTWRTLNRSFAPFSRVDSSP